MTDSDCPEGQQCTNGKCVKQFDSKIVRVDSPVKKGDVFDFTYLVKNPLGSGVDVEIVYWFEKDGIKVLEGSEIIFVEAGQEKEVMSSIPLKQGMLGDYKFIVEVRYNGQSTRASNDIEIATEVPLKLDISISRLPPKIKQEPTTLTLAIGSNIDDRIRVRLNQVVMKGNEVVWSHSQYLSLQAAKRFEQEFPALEPGEYTWVITVASGDVVEKITRTIVVEGQPELPEPTIEEILDTTAARFAFVGVLLVIAAIISWHNIVIVRVLQPRHRVRKRVKRLYVVVFIIAVITLFGFAAYAMSAALNWAIYSLLKGELDVLGELANDPYLKVVIEVIKGRIGEIARLLGFF